MMAHDALISRLESLVSAPCVRTDADTVAAYAIADCRPAIVVQPETIEQAVDVLTLAGRERLAVAPWGQGTQMHIGAVPRQYDLALSLAGLSRVVEYDVANLTVIAEAGVPLREVYRLSVPERQFLPLGFPGAQASLGGLLVTNTSGVKRARYSALRDLILGVRVALPDGSLSHFGGRVMKNVAGYDMNKLFVGSLGVFGVVLETCYRLAALPEDDQLLAVVFPTLDQALAAAAAVQASPLQPSALLLMSAEAAGTTGVPLSVQTDQIVLMLNVDGPHEAVERQIRDGQAYAQQHGGLDEALLTGQALLMLWEWQERWQAAPEPAGAARLHVRLGVLPSCLDMAVAALTTSQAFCPQGVQWYADYVHGQVFAHLPLHAVAADEVGLAVQTWLTQLRRQARDWQGYGEVTYAPPVIRRQLDMWGESPGAALLRLYKQQFDPQAILNPGRYVAGL